MSKLKSKPLEEIVIAIRSNDADNEAYWLISPIGLQEVAKIAAACFVESQSLTAYNNLSLSIEYQYAFLSGDRTQPWLPKACYHNMCAVDLFDKIFIKDRRYEPANNQFDYTFIPSHGLKAIAEAYAEGAIKYGNYNCEKGFPISNLLNHSLRHQYLFLAGDQSENQLGHAGWNLLMACHSFIEWPTLNNDLRPIK